MSKKNNGVTIPVLDPNFYFHWKVKMHLHLSSIDESYVDCIDKGPHVPMRANVGLGIDVGLPIGRLVPKQRSEFTDSEIEEVHKDKKTMNIPFNGLDQDMFDNVINCATSKEVWDTIQTLFQCTEQVKENKMQLLIQKYEHFHSKKNENLTDVFSRFQKLLNGLKIYGRVYQTKDSNLKFLRSLSKEWKPMTVSLRQSQDFSGYTLERLYGVLKTYELELQQDEEMEKSQKKVGTVALVAKVRTEEEGTKKEVVEDSAPKSASGLKNDESSKGKGKMVEVEEGSSGEEDEELDDYLAFLSKKFSKLRFKRNTSANNSRRTYQSGKEMIDKSKVKCFSCGVAGHFAN